MPGDKHETTLQEILRSPLDDMPERSVPPWLPIVGGFAAAALVGFLAISWLGSDESAPTTIAAEEPGTDGTAVTTGAPGTSGASSGTTGATTLVGPEPAILPIDYFGPEVVAADDVLAIIGGFTPAGGIGRDAVMETFFVDLADSDDVTAVDGPAPLLWHGSVYVPDRDAVLVFGGGNAEFRRCNRFRNLCSGSDSDLMWLLDLSTGEWSRIEPANEGPEARFGHVMVHHPPTGLVVVYGGGAVPDRVTGTFYSDTWVFDLETLEWQRRTDGPAGRVHAAATYHPATGTVAVYGGDVGSVDTDNTLWGYDVEANEWRALDDSGDPEGRWVAQMVTIPSTGDLLLVGGAGPRETQIEGGSGTRLDIVGLDDVWVWSGAWEARNALADDVGGWLVATADHALLVSLGHEPLAYEPGTDEWVAP